MKVKHLLVGLGATLCSSVFVSSVFATTYSYDVDVQFNFNSKLAVTITDADIKILDLAPGTSADSNIVGITISTNNVAGYTAEATVGNAQNATTNMTHANGTNTFASIATDASQASLTTDNTWGYVVSTDNGTSWSNFSGLPVYTEDGKQLASTDSPAQDAIQFKINAKAAPSQPAGDYTNVINFKVIANTPPKSFDDVFNSDPTIPRDPETHLPTMQAMNETICETVEELDTEYQLTDSRDHKTYYISKLKDGHCWMTQNLDLDLDGTKTYTHSDTDLGWGSDKSTMSWKPDESTIPVSDISSSGYANTWSSSGTLPRSLDAGDWYWIGNWKNNGADTWYIGDILGYDYLDIDNDGAADKFSRTPYSGNGLHGHVGNYYNWTAAIASNDSSSYSSSTYSDTSNNPQNSICPAGWRLPTISSDDNVQWSTNEFERLNSLYTNSSRDDKAFTASPLWFVRGGSENGPLSRAGYQGYYHSSTVGDGTTRITTLCFYGYGFECSVADSTRSYGRSVRCLARDNKAMISFNGNGGTGVMNHLRIENNQTVNLPENNFTNSGYVFNGWNTKPNGKGDGYGDKAQIDATHNIVLYAQWKQDDGTMSDITIQRAYELAYTENGKGMYIRNQDGSYHEMQPDETVPGGTDTRFAMQDIDLTYNGTKVCDLVTVVGDQYQALDVRDWKLYYISKLADGRCWMTQNLDLDLSSNKTLTSDTTDIPDSWTPSLSTNDDYIDKTTVQSRGISQRNGNEPGSFDFGDYYWNGTTSSGTETSLVTDCFDSTGNAHYNLGNYYTFAAATATNNGSAYEPDTIVNQSICPAGWTLPNASDSSESMNGLNTIYRDNGPTKAPLYMTPTGSVSINYSEYNGQYSNYFASSYFTLNRVSPDSSCTDDGCYKSRYFHPGGANGMPSPDDVPGAYPSIPRFLAIPVRCIAR